MIDPKVPLTDILYIYIYLFKYEYKYIFGIIQKIHINRTKQQ